MQHLPLKDKVGQNLISEGHKIGYGDKNSGHESVKLEGNNEENWNVAMNNILRTINRLLAYVSRQERNQPPPISVHQGITAAQIQQQKQSQTQTQQTQIQQAQTQSATITTILKNEKT